MFVVANYEVCYQGFDMNQLFAHFCFYFRYSHCSTLSQITQIIIVLNNIAMIEIKEYFYNLLRNYTGLAFCCLIPFLEKFDL